MRPLGDIMFGPRAANFPVSLTQGCRIVTISTTKCNNSPKSFPHPAKRNGRNINEVGHKISEERSFLEM